MPLQYHNLDRETRQHMLIELDRDIQGGTLYLSARLTSDGRQHYPAMLREAIEQHDDAWLAGEIRRRGLLESHEEKKKPKGGTTLAAVPVTAPDTLAEGEFNRFYCRGVCARVAEVGESFVEVYRGKEVLQPRPESEARIGARLEASAVLQDLRTSIAVEPALGVPAGPNSGLTIRRVVTLV